ncbi:MAG: 3'-5' exonuclease domain-containing protein 2 [Bacteroidaceae bacterium]|nr:3'-5' exonuclease domain-containing protein 2 [Bacteroidaceae bacterium]MDE6159484.1 3'-5' exonuclease domain-containing protein 2 [Bacteroidaceae bacterium]
MSKKLLSRFDKKQIPGLPIAQFQGRIIEVRSEQEAEKAVDYLLRQDVLGFDTETRPSFTRGRCYKVALLQVSSREICFLFRLTFIGFPSVLSQLFTDTKVTKVGLSWADDVRSLRKRVDLECSPFVELQTFAAEMGIKDMSLQKLYANVFGQRISKTQQLSNWEAENYSEAQRLYAATDAWACIQLYEALSELRRTGDYEVEEVPAPEPPCPRSILDEKPKTEKKRPKRRRNDKKKKPSKSKKNKNDKQPVS